MQYRLFLLASLGLAACGSAGSASGDATGEGGAGPGFGGTTDLEPGAIVGIETDSDVADRIAWLRVAVTRDGDEEVVELGRDDGSSLEFPLEVPVAPQRNGAPIDVELEAFDADGDLLVDRRLSTVARDERKLLIRLRLEDECIEGEPDTPSCESNQTCVARHCDDPFVKPEHLPDYDESWAEPYADACCEADAGDAVATLGHGQGEFSLLEQGQELYLEAGPQGGHHVWLGVRIENLHEGAQTMLRGHALNQPYEFLAIPSVEEYEPFGDGCEVVGLRYELRFNSPHSGTSASVLVGEPVRFEVTVIDPTGKAAIAELDAVLTDVPPAS